MPRTLPAAIVTEANSLLVQERFIIAMGFATPLRYSSVGSVTWDLNTYTYFDMSLRLLLDGSGGTLTLRDSDFLFATEAIDEGFGGITCDVWIAHGSDTTPAVGDVEYAFSGELGPGGMSDDVWTISLVEPQAKYMPDIQINESNGFNHLPPDGTRFETPNGIIELRRQN